MSETRTTEQILASVDAMGEQLKDLFRAALDQQVAVIGTLCSMYESEPRTVPDKDLLRAALDGQVVAIGGLRDLYESGPSTVPATEMVFTLDLALQMAVLASWALGERN